MLKCPLQINNLASILKHFEIVTDKCTINSGIISTSLLKGMHKPRLFKIGVV
jgi:hypothetical protein